MKLWIIKKDIPYDIALLESDREQTSAEETVYSHVISQRMSDVTKCADFGRSTRYAKNIHVKS